MLTYHDIEGWLFVSAIFNFIVFVAFLALCDNISKLKKKAFEKETANYWFDEYNKQRYLGNDTEAKTALQNLVWYGLKKKRTLKNYEDLKAKYQSTFDNFGIKFPDYPY